MDAPDAFVAFVAEHEAEVRAAARDITGSESTVRHLAVLAFATVAARWEWLHPDGRWARLRRPLRWPGFLRYDPDAGRRALYRAVHKMRVDWRDELPVDNGLEWEVLGSDHQRYSLAPPVPPGAEAVAIDAWDEGLRLRRRHNLMVRGGLAGLALLTVLLPRGSQDPYVVPEREPVLVGPSLPVNVPPNVELLPGTDELDWLSRRATLLPTEINADVAAARPLAAAPVPRVVAAVRNGSNPLVLVAPDGQTRRVERADLGDARLLTTSVSPDGSRVVLIQDPFLVVVTPATGTVRKVRAPIDAQPAQPRLIWRDGRTVLVPGAIGATVIDVDTGKSTFEMSVNVLHMISPQGPARQAYTTELIPIEGGNSSGQIRIRRTPPTGASPTPTGRVDIVPVSAPTWMGEWIGQGWGNSRLYIRPCDPRTLLLPHDLGTAQDPVGVVDHRGLAIRTLTAVEQGVTMDVLGWLNPAEALIRVAHDRRSWLLSWDPVNNQFRLVSRIAGPGRTAVADLYRP